MIMIGIIAGLSLIALGLAILSLLLMKKTQRKTYGDVLIQNRSPVKNVYSQDPRVTEVRSKHWKLIILLLVYLLAVYEEWSGLFNANCP